MILVAVVAIAVVAGAPWSVVATGAAFGVAPFPVTILLAGFAGFMAMRRSRTTRTAASEAELFRSLAASVAAGSTLRASIEHSDHPSVTAAVVRLCSVGAPMRRIGLELGDSLPVNGRSFSALCAMSELTGSSIADALGGFAERANAAEETRRRRRVSLTQVRMSAWVVGVAPLVLTALVLWTQGVPKPGGAIVILPIVVGSALQVTGMLVVFSVSGKAIT